MGSVCLLSHPYHNTPKEAIIFRTRTVEELTLSSRVLFYSQTERDVLAVSNMLEEPDAELIEDPVLPKERGGFIWVGKIVLSRGPDAGSFGVLGRPY